MMFVRTSTHEALKADFELAIAQNDADRETIKELRREVRQHESLGRLKDETIGRLRQDQRTTGAALSEALKERDAARAELQPFLARRAKAMLNLRQNKKAAQV